MRTILLSFLLAAQLTPAVAGGEFAETVGQLKDVTQHGDWTTARVVEMDGTLSGCFASTPPVKGKLPNEIADLNLLAYKERGDLKRWIGISEVRASGIGMGGLASLLTDAGSSAGSLDSLAASFLVSEQTPRGTYVLKSAHHPDDDWQLQKGNQAGLTVPGGREPVYYSLAGSSAAMNTWRACISQL